MINKITHGDCLELMNNISDGSVDIILCDLPYGTTACKWDTVIPFQPLWEHYKRVIKPNGAIVLFGSQPFTSALIMSNVKMFRHCLVWEKDNCSNFMMAKIMPLKYHEDICVFSSEKNPLYNPIKWDAGKISNNSYGKKIKPNGVFNDLVEKNKSKNTSSLRYPKSIIKVNRCKANDKDNTYNRLLHPTQKPVELLEYLIKTYTNEGETVLDNCIGSGSTAISAINTGRNFIGIEKDEDYFNIANARIKNHIENSIS